MVNDNEQIGNIQGEAQKESENISLLVILYNTKNLKKKDNNEIILPVNMPSQIKNSLTKLVKQNVAFLESELESNNYLNTVEFYQVEKNEKSAHNNNELKYNIDPSYAMTADPCSVMYNSILVVGNGSFSILKKVKSLAAIYLDNDNFTFLYKIKPSNKTAIEAVFKRTNNVENNVDPINLNNSNSFKNNKITMETNGLIEYIIENSKEVKDYIDYNKNSVKCVAGHIVQSNKIKAKSIKNNITESEEENFISAKESSLTNTISLVKAHCLSIFMGSLPGGIIEFVKFGNNSLESNSKIKYQSSPNPETHKKNVNDYIYKSICDNQTILGVTNVVEKFNSYYNVGKAYLELLLKIKHKYQQTLTANQIHYSNQNLDDEINCMKCFLAHVGYNTPYAVANIGTDKSASSHKTDADEKEDSTCNNIEDQIDNYCLEIFSENLVNTMVKTFCNIIDSANHKQENSVNFPIFLNHNKADKKESSSKKEGQVYVFDASPCSDGRPQNIGFYNAGNNSGQQKSIKLSCYRTCDSGKLVTNVSLFPLGSIVILHNLVGGFTVLKNIVNNVSVNPISQLLEQIETDMGKNIYIKQKASMVAISADNNNTKAEVKIAYGIHGLQGGNTCGIPGVYCLNLTDGLSNKFTDNLTPDHISRNSKTVLDKLDSILKSNGDAINNNDISSFLNETISCFSPQVPFAIGVESVGEICVKNTNKTGPK